MEVYVKSRYTRLEIEAKEIQVTPNGDLLLNNFSGNPLAGFSNGNWDSFGVLARPVDGEKG